MFNGQLKNLNLGYDKKLELARDYISEINNRNLANKDLLKSMRRSFSARIGHQKRQARLAGILPKSEEIGNE